MAATQFVVLLSLRVVIALYWFAWHLTIQGHSMLHLTPTQLLNASWLVFLLYWLISAFRVKKTARRQNPVERMLYVLFMIAGFLLLNANNYPLGVLDRRFLPDARWIAWLGSYLCAAGVLFSIWARYTIGQDWSAEVQIKEGHELVRSGPYARIRHPIYTGILLAALGTAILIGEYRALLAVAVLFFGFVHKARNEESFLAVEFGAAFAEHRRRTGFFLPRLT
ncbi:MAG: isoprenylcysteine carboxylmethyltransferase family protein [Candidatus Acidiferrales bacterium]